VWADVEWDAGQAAATSVSHDPYETAIRADQAALEHRYAGVPIWFGRSTLKWWALVGGDELVTASSPKAMADALDAALAARARAAAAGAQDTAGGAGAVYFPRQRVGDDAPAAPASPMESAAVPPMRAMPAAGSLARRAS
jgi:hypothetical protein